VRRCSTENCEKPLMCKGLCSNCYVKKAYAKNREKIKAQKKIRYKEKYGKTVRDNYNPLDRRAKALWSKYGLTLEDYKKMENSQNGCCKICEKEPEFVRRKNGLVKLLVVDHNHETGNIRGLLCASCNVALGNFKDDIRRLEKAIIYLKGEANE